MWGDIVDPPGEDGEEEEFHFAELFGVDGECGCDGVKDEGGLWFAELAGDDEAGAAEEAVVAVEDVEDGACAVEETDAVEEGFGPEGPDLGHVEHPRDDVVAAGGRPALFGVLSLGILFLQRHDDGNDV